MEANQYALVHGMARTKVALARWRQDPRPVLLGWFAGALAISALLLLAVWAIASAIPPDLGFDYLPSRPTGPDTERVLALVGRNSIVLALHAFACIAGFIAGSALPLS